MQISAELGVTEQMVSYTLKGNLGVNGIDEALEQREEELKGLAARIKSMSVEALDTLDSLMHNDNTPPSVRLKAAQDIMDRAGFAPERNVNIRGAIAHLTPQDIAEMKGRIQAEKDARAALEGEDAPVIQLEGGRELILTHDSMLEVKKDAGNQPTP